MIKVSIIFGTRPETIKLASVIKAFEKEKEIALNVCFTGQHQEMVLPLLRFFEITINHSLDLMQPNQTLSTLSSSSLTALDEYLRLTEPDVVFVQGDTTTAMCAAISAFYRKVKIAHVEAGLRTYDMHSPFPEEFNRQVISKITDIHFAPTVSAAQNLLNENIKPCKVIVTGNTVIDALFFTKDKLSTDLVAYQRQYPWDENENRMILITGHRRENFGDGFENICLAVKALATKYPAYNFVYPVHLNPSVQEPVKRILNDIANVYLIPPVDYVQFTLLMSKCYFILTDSGGVQEEAPSLGKPVLVMRDATEREEAVKAGTAKLVGTNREMIIESVTRLIEDETLYQTMSGIENPFGDGQAAGRIVKQTLSYFQ